MITQTSPVATLAKLKLEHWTQGSLYESTDTSFGAALDLPFVLHRQTGGGKGVLDGFFAVDGDLVAP